MKPKQVFFLAGIIAAGFVLSDSSLTSAADAENASVSFLEGEASRSADGNKWELLQTGSLIYKDDIVKTGAPAKMEIRLPDGSAIRVSESSMMKLDSVYFGKDKKERKVSVKLMLGKLWSKASSMFGSTSKFEVTTQNAVAGVRGTTFRVNAYEDKSVLVRVYAGSVAVTNPVLAMPEHKKGERKQVPKPGEVTKAKWEEIVAQAMQEVRVTATGEIEFHRAFASADEASDEWVKWNEEMDKKL